MVLGLAPAAHGANRTGRVFTGDRSGDLLFAALHRAGLANQSSVRRRGGWVGAQRHSGGGRGALRAAGRMRRPRPSARRVRRGWTPSGGCRCRRAGHHRARRVRVAGGAGHGPRGRWLGRASGAEVRPRRDGLVQTPHGEVTLIGCYHPSQQNTFTGRLTPEMLDDVFGKAAGNRGKATRDACVDARMRLSVLDLVPVRTDQSTSDALAASTQLAQTADRLGYTRYWVAEHHNMPSVAATSPPVLIAHLAAQDLADRLGSGGVMLPNHAPLAVAEQFALLEAAHPGRIDLGIGRAPGSDPVTSMPLRGPAGRDDTRHRKVPASISTTWWR